MTALTKRIQNAIRLRYDILARKIASKEHLSLKLATDFEDFGNDRKICSLTGRTTTLSSPVLYDTNLQEVRQPSFTVKSPDVHLIEFKNVQAVGGTMALIREGKVLYPEMRLTEVTHDYKTPKICRFADSKRTTLDFNVISRPVIRKKVRVGLHLLKEHSFNYYHWISEVMPRLAYFAENYKRLGEDVEITILIDNWILDQAVEAMRLLVNFPSKVMIVRRGELVQCDRLYCVSEFWHALDNSKHGANPQRDYATDKQAIEIVRGKFVAKTTAKPTRKIYLPRVASQVRRIINSQQVEDLMREQGFEILQAHDYTFEQQIELFSSARVVVGASGAPFTNMIFMQPGSKAVIFSPKQFEIFNYHIFQQFADVAGVELAHLLAVPKRHEGFFVHDDFSVNCDDLRTLIRRLG